MESTTQGAHNTYRHGRANQCKRCGLDDAVQRNESDLAWIAADL